MALIQSKFARGASFPVTDRTTVSIFMSPIMAFMVMMHRWPRSLIS